MRAATLTLVVLLSGAAAAQEGGYGAQLAVSDAAAALIAGVALARGDGRLWIPAAAVFVAGPMMIHFAHGRPDGAASSLFIRVGLPLGAALLGVTIAGATVVERGSDGTNGLYRAVAGGIIGLTAGAVGAGLIDALVIAQPPSAEDHVGWSAALSASPRRLALAVRY